MHAHSPVVQLPQVCHLLTQKTALLQLDFFQGSCEKHAGGSNHTRFTCLNIMTNDSNIKQLFTANGTKCCIKLSK